MDKYCFLLSSESSDYYYNQLKFLLFSLRNYGGNLKDSFVYVSINDANLQEHRVRFLQENFAPIKIVNNVVYKPKKRFSRGWFRKHMKFDRKYHVFSHFNKLNEFDKFVYMDTDMLVLEDFSDELEKHKEASFVAGTEFGSNAVIKNCDEFLSIFFKNNINKINNLKNSWTLKLNDHNNKLGDEKTCIPSFQAGFFMTDKNSFNLINNMFDYILELIKYKRTEELQLEAWAVEQQALSFLIMDKVDNYELLNSLDEGSLCKLYHYYASLYGRGHYENPLEINHEEYQKTDKLKHMSNVITEFNEKYGTN